MAFTVTATQSGSSATTGITLLVRVLTNAVETGGATHGSRTTSGSPAPSGSLTPNFSGSWVGFALSADNNTTMSAAAASNIYDYSTSNPGQLWSAAHGHYTGTVTAATPLTYGAGSVPSGQDHANWCAYEVPASGGTLAIDGSSPAGANNTGSAAVTSASFTPPGSCVLAAMVVAGGSGSGTGITITITDTSGLGLVWTQRAVSLAADNFQPTFIYTATMGGAAPAPQPAGARSQPGGRVWRRRYRRVQQPFPPQYQTPQLSVTAGLATATGAAQSPIFQRYIAGLAGGTAGYFVDQSGNPRLFYAAVPWGLPANAGRWNSGNWQSDFDTYFADIAAQGMTAAIMHPWGHSHTGCNNDAGNTWDSVSPWTTIPTLNNTFWARIDYLLAAALRNGITVFLDLTMQCDMGMDAFSGTGVFNGTSAATLTTAATNIAARYAAQPNLIHLFGDDYNNNDDTRMSAVLTGLRAGGYTGPIGVEYYSSGTTSRRDLSGSPTGTQFPFGGSNAGFNWGYYYNVTYFAVEQAYKENSQIPVLWGDGFYVGGGAGEPADKHLMRNFVWWALASGARGVSMGSESVLNWQSTAFTDITVNHLWYVQSALPVYTYFAGLAGWQNLLPDNASSLVTAGRGTRAAYSSTDFQAANLGSDNYVAASVTPDKSLAVIYCAVAMSITIDQTKIATGYTATWVDPASGATSTATTGSTYNSSGKGNNSAGNADWVLVLQGPPSTSANAALASGTGTAQGATASTVTGTNAQAGLATGAGAALNGAASVGVTAVPATEAGAALNAAPAVAVTAAPATEAGAALNPAATSAASPAAVLAAGTGTAQSPALAAAVTAAAATGTGAALNATASTVTSGTATATLASGAGTALSPAAAITYTVTAVLPSGAGAARAPAVTTAASPAVTAAAGTGTALNPAASTAAAPASVLASGTGTALGATASTVTAGTGAAALASGTGTARNPAAAVTVTAALATGAGTAQGATASTASAGTANAAAATGTGAARNPAPAIAVPAGLAGGTGAALAPATAGSGVARLMDGISGRPGNGPAAPAAYAGNFIAGTLWKTTVNGLWLTGYWHWVPPGGDTIPRKFALWQLTDTTHGTTQALVPAGTVTSGTLTAGQWNYVPLPAPIGLSGSVPYVACYGYVAVNGFPDTQNQFGSGQPYAAGITSGPLFAYSGQGTATAEPYTSNYDQGVFSVASSDPAAVMPTTADQHSNFWVDVQVSYFPPAGASYRLWPSQPYATGWVDDTADNFTLGCEFTLNQPCVLGKIWFYSQPGVTQLPTECGIWNVAAQALVSGTDNASPSWSGTAGSGWVSVSYTGVTLPAGDYKVAVLNSAGVPAIWNPTTNGYWGTGTGAGGVASGPLAAPDTAHATSPGQDTYNLGAAFTYPLTYAGGANGANYWVDVEVQPPFGAPAAGLASGGGTAQGPAVAVAVTATAATGTGAALGAVAASAASPAAVLAGGAGAARNPAPAIGVSAAPATGAGAALGATVTATAIPAAILAAGTGAALNAAASTTTAGTANAALASGTGTAGSTTPAIGVTATLASGTGTALNATVSTAAFTNANAGLATGTGTARQPSLTLTSNATAAVATAAGTTGSVPAIGVNTAPATGAGTGRNAVGQIGWVAPAGLATGTGAAQAPVAVLVSLAQAAAASGLGAALRATAKTVDPFTVGALTTATAGGVLTAATSSGGGTLTASDQRTGGPT